MSQEWLGPTIPAFERAKTVHALDRAATVTGVHRFQAALILFCISLRFEVSASIIFRHLSRTENIYTLESVETKESGQKMTGDTADRILQSKQLEPYLVQLAQ
jgi:pentose-5-phosphate-3-epimerase